MNTERDQQEEEHGKRYTREVTRDQPEEDLTNLEVQDRIDSMKYMNEHRQGFRTLEE